MQAVGWSLERAQALIDSEMKRARAFLGDDGTAQSALLPILHALQHHFGFVPPQAITVVADALNLSKAEVKGVVSFYKDLRTSPPGEHVVALCRAEACQARGSEAVAAHLERTHGLSPGSTRRGVTLTNTYCLGNCALGPAALVDDTRLVGRLDLHAADALVASLRPGEKS